MMAGGDRPLTQGQGVVDVCVHVCSVHMCSLCGEKDMNLGVRGLKSCGFVYT